MNPAPYLNASQVAEHFGISRGLVLKMVRQGTLPKPRHFGRAARWRLADLEAMERKPGAEASA